MDNLEKWIQNNHLNDPDDIDALLDTADIVRQLICDNNCVGVNKVINYTIENSLYEAFSWIMALDEEYMITVLKKADPGMRVYYSEMYTQQ